MENNDIETQTKLEIRFAFLERQLEELSDTVAQQSRRLERAENRIRQLTDRLQEEVTPLNPNARPPHY